MITLLLWLCPFTWPFAIARMMRKSREKTIRSLGGPLPAKRRSPLGWLFHKAWTAIRPTPTDTLGKA